MLSLNWCPIYTFLKRSTMNSCNWCTRERLGIGTYKVGGKETPKRGCFRRLQHSSSQTSTTKSQGWRMLDDTWTADSSLNSYNDYGEGNGVFQDYMLRGSNMDHHGMCSQRDVESDDEGIPTGFGDNKEVIPTAN
jgi:hypothetical protein